jgi:hypothetical protein
VSGVLYYFEQCCTVQVQSGEQDGCA